VYRAGALPINSVSFHGVGVTINLTFPEEAHPLDYISHNVTITANIDLTLENFTLFIYAPVNSIWQEVKNRTINWDFLASESLTSRIEFQLPQNTNGTLYCLMYVKTDQSTDYSSYTFYTTKVSTTTFSEWQSEYNKLLANYTRLQSDYETLLSEYDELLANYTSLLADYDTLVSEYNELLADYNSRVAAYESLLNNYNSLSHDYNTLNFNYQSLRDDKNELQSDYNTLNLDYNSLNSTYYSVQASYDQLKTDFGSLNRTYTDLLTEINDLNQKIAFSENALSTDRVVMFIFIITVAALVVLIMYLKRKKQEPYLVIRKETVAIKPDEKPKIEPVS
jgi:predicted nuclease with TOPRIM domain